MKPILFNTEMVRAILEGRKTVTRRVAKTMRKNSGTSEFYTPVMVNDVLYVRETWKKYSKRVGKGETCHIEERFAYKADGDRCEVQKPSEWYEGNWKPSLHMPKEAARIFLRVTDVRLERLQDITEEQAKKEGLISSMGFVNSPDDEYSEKRTAREKFTKLWDSAIKKGQIERYGWEANPYVWVIEFEVIDKPEEG